MAWPPAAAVAAPGLPRLLPAAALDLAGHVRVHGPLRYAGAPGGLIEEIRAAGLTGRGGAAFPVAVKMAAVADQPGRAGVAGNGAEGEPASHKDRHLLWLAPHLVLDGLQLAAEAVGARRAILYVHRHDQLHRLLVTALAERSAAGVTTRSRPRSWPPRRGSWPARNPRWPAGSAAGSPCPRSSGPRCSSAASAARPPWCRTSSRWPMIALIVWSSARLTCQACTAVEPGACWSPRTGPTAPARSWRYRSARRWPRCSSWAASPPRRCWPAAITGHGSRPRRPRRCRWPMPR